MLKSFICDNAEFKVLGIGVAVNVITSMLCFNFLIFSLSATPNLCSSSIISNLISLNSIFFDNNA